MANIFISYRREDSGGHTGRLCDRLTARFGRARVFMDLQDIAPGQNFAQSIDEMIATCDCVASLAPARALDGGWIAEMQKEGQPLFRIRFNVAVAGESITGIVRYPTGDAPILDARLAGRVLTFPTSHVPQFGSTPATIRYQAEVGGDEIRFTTTDDYGIGKGVARRQR